ncbi:hypothetical protein [Clostridium sp. CF012]|uniref:hypothetical protein n=1 Tax=Clostridium sp. CF012 TaxID=2843319 RepID=UPI001C0DBCC0|nr:hypothetical protein [Clostridium sp. CF012]MBU3144627.1 hypothetical protein [Clostridium sp. CF012]
MRKEEFAQWLRVVKKLGQGTISSRVSNVLRVNRVEGDLDKHYQENDCKILLNKLEYSKLDYSEKKPLNHKIIIDGNYLTGTATLKRAVKLYLEFCRSVSEDIDNCTEVAIIVKTKKKIVKDIVKNNNKEINSIILDSYECFTKKFNITKTDFYNFGLEETIYPLAERVEEYWDELKKRLFNNKKVYIRGYGRDAHGTPLYKEFHVKVFGNENVKKDPTNNLQPQKLIQKLTGFRRNDNLMNYQVSHIFGMTRNALMFEAPWNIALVPKIIDPLTGHESNGDWAKEYKELFLKDIYIKYAKYIDEYNQLANKYDFQGKIAEFGVEKASDVSSEYFNLKKRNKLLSDLSNDFRFL